MMSKSFGFDMPDEAYDQLKKIVTQGIAEGRIGPGM
jgi:hypothetical protein